MSKNYTDNVKIFKALSDSNRLKILDILSCGEKCACDILEYFNFTQPTLSHHMKVLIDCGLVLCRKEKLWNYYSLNTVNCNEIVSYIKELFTDTEDCICKQNKKCTCDKIIEKDS